MLADAVSRFSGGCELVSAESTLTVGVLVALASGTIVGVVIWVGPSLLWAQRPSIVLKTVLSRVSGLPQQR